MISTWLAIPRALAVDYSVGCDPDPAARVAELIDRINDANASASDDNITLTAGCTYTLTVTNNIDVSGPNGLPVIQDTFNSGALTILGNGASIERAADAADLFRIFNVASGGNLTLDHLIVTKGALATVTVIFSGTGGGIHNEGQLTLINSSITNNQSGDCGGGIANDRPNGGFFHLGDGTLTITNSTISGNTANSCGGGLFVNTGAVTMTDSTISGNTANGGGLDFFSQDCSGGGLFNDANLTLTRSTISDNSGVFSGGGICSGAEVTMTDSIVSSNVAGHSGGGISSGSNLSITHSTISDNTATQGGGIFAHGSLTLTSSAVNHNTASGQGGGIYNDDSSFLNVVNSTVAGNTASDGGGIYNLAGITIANSTVSGNTAPIGAGIDNAAEFYSKEFDNSIIANSIGGADCVGNPSTLRRTLIEDGSCGASNGDENGNRTGDPNLGELEGSPAYLPLIEGSIAIDAGDNTLIPPIITTDQAGNPRVQGGLVDLGAYESAFVCPAQPYTVDAGDTLGLINAINCANSLGGSEITLTNSTYTFNTPENTANSANALPVITTPITIHGDGAIIERQNSPGPAFRLLEVGSGASLSLDHLTLSNAIAYVDGGAIHNDDGSVVLSSVTLNGNTADKGGALYNASGTMTVIDSVLSGNSSNGYAGAIWNGGTMTLTRVTLTGNTVSNGYVDIAGGGAIYNSGTLTLTDSTLEGNNAYGYSPPAGGIWTSGTMTVTNSTLRQNQSSRGGGLFIAGGSVILTNSTLDTNQASINDNDGDSIYVADGSLVVTNSTIINYSLRSGVEGITVNGGSATVTNTTITHGTGVVANGGALALNNSIVAYNDYSEYGTTNCAGAGITISHSLIQDGSCGVTDGVNGNKTGDPLLGFLIGGPPAYYYLNAGSPAIDAGDNALISDGVTTDQAGKARIQDGTVDMGSFEFDAASPILSIDDVFHNEGISGTTIFTFTVSLSAPAGESGVTFDIATADNTATAADNDYTAHALTGQTIPAGETSYSFDVTVTGDYQEEDNETFFVNVSSVVGATVGDSQGIGTIQADDQFAGFFIEPDFYQQTTEDGGAASIFISLTTQPISDVTVNLSSSNPAEGVADSTSLTFTSENWDQAQMVTVTGVDDAVYDREQFYQIITSPAISDDPRYSGFDPQDANFVNLDNDPPPIIIDPTYLFTSESGDSAPFTVVLSAQPTADVTIGLSSNNPSEGIPDHDSLTFTPDNWNTPQTITVNSVDDHVIDGQMSYQIVTSSAVSDDPAFNGFDPDDVQAYNNDDDIAGVIAVPPDGLVTTEGGGTATFTVTLRTMPTGNVSVSVYSSNYSEGTASPFQLSFTPDDWNVPQTVTVTGQDDSLVDGSVDYSIQITSYISDDPYYQSMEPTSVVVTNLDDEVPSFKVNPTSGLVTSEDGGTAYFTITMRTPPLEGTTTTVNLSSSNPNEGTINQSSLTFDSNNLSQTVFVTGVDDQVADGDVAYSIITDAAISDDPAYNGLNPDDVSVTNTDNDVPGIIVNAFTLTTTEAGGTDTFTVVLHWPPTADVVIGLISDNTAEGTVDPASLTFTPDNWNLPQTVTVSGVDDAVRDGYIYYTIITSPAISDDPGYNGLDAADVSAINLDNDEPGIKVDPAGGLITTEAGGTATFTVMLFTQPSGNVTLGLSSGSPDEGTVAPVSMIFTPDNWNVPQIATVTGVDDQILDGYVSYYIDLNVTASDDPLYLEGETNSVNLTNVDNDVAGITVTPTSGLVTTEDGGVATFTLAMNAQPSYFGATTTIDLSSSNPAEGTVDPASVTFSYDNWNEPQTVTVTGVDDVLVDGNVPYTIVTSPAVSPDYYYNGLDPDDVSVVNQDNEIPPNVISAIKTARDVNGGVTSPGDVIEYTITINNTGTDPATGVTLTDAVPANTTYVPGSATLNEQPFPDGDGGVMPFASGAAVNSSGEDQPVGQIDVGIPAVITFQVTVNQPLPNEVTLISNQGTVSGDGFEPALTDDGSGSGATVTPIMRGLSISKSFVTPQIEVGATSELRFTLSNPLENPALTGLTFTDPLPIGLNFLQPNPAQCGGTVGLTDDHTLSLISGTLEPGASCVVIAIVKADGAASGTLTNLTTPLSAEGGLTSAAGATATLKVIIPGPPGLPAEHFLCSNLNEQSPGAMTGSGGILNLHLGGESGNSYCHVIAQNGNFLASPAEIGIQSVLDLGVIDAIDVSGMLPNGVPVILFDQPVRVCLRGTGEVLFLNAATAGRTVERLTVTTAGGYSCVDIPNAGTVVLVHGNSGLTEPPPATPATPATPVSTALSQCEVTTTNAPINLRAEPNTSAAILAKLPYNLMLTATERVPGWYRVIYLDGQGWISARFLMTLGNCGD